MNNEKPLNQMIEELKPEEYTDFVNCMKENFGTANCQNPTYYRMLESLLRDPHNRAHYVALSKGCQIAMILYVEVYERNLERQKQITEAMKGLTE